MEEECDLYLRHALDHCSGLANVDRAMVPRQARVRAIAR